MQCWNNCQNKIYVCFFCQVFRHKILWKSLTDWNERNCLFMNDDGKFYTSCDAPESVEFSGSLKHIHCKKIRHHHNLRFHDRNIRCSKNIRPARWLGRGRLESMTWSSRQVNEYQPSRRHPPKLAAIQAMIFFISHSSWWVHDFKRIIIPFVLSLSKDIFDKRLEALLTWVEFERMLWQDYNKLWTMTIANAVFLSVCVS